MSEQFDNDPLILELRKKYPKQGPDPKPKEPLDQWAERFLEWVRSKHMGTDAQ